MEQPVVTAATSLEKPAPGVRIARIERILARVFLGLVSLVLAGVAFEMVSPWILGDRRVGIESAYPVGFVRKPMPYTMFSGTPAKPFNDLGFPGPSPTQPKNPGEYRIFVLGGSTVVNGEPPIAQLVEQEFHIGGREHVRVFNCGVVSSASGQDLARIVFDLADHQPDLIVMYNGGNDIIEPIHYDPRPGYPFNFLLYENNPLLESDIKEYPAWTLLAYGSHTCRYFGTWWFMKRLGKINEVRAEAHYGTEQWQSAIARIYIEHLVKAKRISKAFGADFITFFQPMLAYKEPRVGREIRRVERNPFETAISVDVREKVRAEADRAVQSEELTFVDLSDIYNDVDEEVYWDSIHTWQAAKPRVAQAIHRHIVRLTGAGS